MQSRFVVVSRWNVVAPFASMKSEVDLRAVAVSRCSCYVIHSLELIWQRLALPRLYIVHFSCYLSVVPGSGLCCACASHSQRLFLIAVVAFSLEVLLVKFYFTPLHSIDVAVFVRASRFICAKEEGLIFVHDGRTDTRTDRNPIEMLG